MTHARFRTGIESVADTHPALLKGQRVGLVSHPAAITSSGIATLDLLASACGGRLTALFGPEHGYYGAATAGETVAQSRHRRLGIPIFSLYGKHRKPTPAMLARVDTLVVDLQDLAARPYTYVSTLRLALEAAAEAGKRVIVADRPIPLPNVIDGPVAEEPLSSFVAMVPFPVAYGMTQGEAARAIAKSLDINVDLHVGKMAGYGRDWERQPEWPDWIPPSPGIKSWESATCYTSTVWCEALPSIDYGRGTALQFRVIGAKWMKGAQVSEYMNGLKLAGVSFSPHPYYPAMYSGGAELLDGVRMHVSDGDAF
ncbi:MAG: DUF1343 domain-containing protein, partial [Verrucomicrobia bacterium]|nr:DUF1343 domain-containing protein [Verrucomicrobiota bacterium]